MATSLQPCFHRLASFQAITLVLCLAATAVKAAPAAYVATDPATVTEGERTAMARASVKKAAARPVNLAPSPSAIAPVARAAGPSVDVAGVIPVVNATPEPSTWAMSLLIGCALLAIGFIRTRRVN